MNLKPLLMIAEDDPDDQLMIQLAVETSCPPHVETHFVWDGMELMSALAKRVNGNQPPILVVLDLNMPRKDGRQALREIKSDPKLSKVSIAVLTTSNSEEDLRYCKSFDIVGYYRKPSSVAELEEIVKKLCGEFLN